MAATGLLLPIQQFFDNNGDPLSGGKVSTFVAGTSTPAATYTDSSLLVANTNPIILDSAGRCVIYVDPPTALKIVLADADDVTIWTQDNVSPAQVAS